MRLGKRAIPPVILRTTAENFAKDQVRKGRYRNHLELDQYVQQSEEGEARTLQDVLEDRHHPELITRSAEIEFLQQDRRERIQLYLAELPLPARQIINKRLNKVKLQPAERAWMSSFRKKTPSDLLEDLQELLNE